MFALGAVACVFLYQVIDNYRKQAEQVDVISAVQDQDINKTLDAILLASSSQDVSENPLFVQTTDAINTTALDYLTQKLNLSSADAEAMMSAYYNDRSLVINNIHDVMQQEQHLAGSETKSVYENYNAVNEYSEALGGLLCNTVNVALSTSMHKASSRFFTLKSLGAVEVPCKHVIKDVFKPVSLYLKEQAIIKDIDIFKITLTNRVRKSILELGTAQDDFTFNFYNTRERNFLEDTLGGYFAFKTETKLTTTAKVTVKFGFDLTHEDFYINVDHAKRKISIHLPEAKLISKDIRLRFGTPEKDVLLSPKADGMYNSAYNEASIKLYDYLQDDTLRTEATDNAKHAISTIFEPLMSLPQFNYTVAVVSD